MGVVIKRKGQPCVTCGMYAWWGGSVSQGENDRCRNEVGKWRGILNKQPGVMGVDVGEADLCGVYSQLGR